MLKAVNHLNCTLNTDTDSHVQIVKSSGYARSCSSLTQPLAAVYAMPLTHHGTGITTSSLAACWGGSSICIPTESCLSNIARHKVLEHVRHINMKNIALGGEHIADRAGKADLAGTDLRLIAKGRG